jgi:hypothetical protein
MIQPSRILAHSLRRKHLMKVKVTTHQSSLVVRQMMKEVKLMRLFQHFVYDPGFNPK